MPQAAWPLPFDPSFQPLQAVALQWRFEASSAVLDGTADPRFAHGRVLSVGLGLSRQLDFVSRRDVRWLVGAGGGVGAAWRRV